MSEGGLAGLHLLSDGGTASRPTSVGSGENGGFESYRVGRAAKQATSGWGDGDQQRRQAETGGTQIHAAVAIAVGTSVSQTS